MLKDSMSNTKKWWVLAAMICAFAMLFLDQTAIPVALPQMQQDLKTNSLMLRWIVNAYLLTLASLVIFGGKIGDVYGHRKAFLGGLILFTISSLLVALSPGGQWAVCSRALQGVGGAFMMPAISVIVSSQFNPQERGKAFGILISCSAVFLALGPLAGGLLTQYLSWRFIFWINVPLAIISLVITLKTVTAKVHEVESTNKLDWQGFLWLTTCLFCLICSLMEGPSLGWNSSLILAGFMTSFISLALFIYTELRQPVPLVELDLFKNKELTAAVLILMLTQTVFATMVFLPIYLQNILDCSPAKAGAMMLPMILPTLFMPAIGGKLLDKLGPRIPALLGTFGLTVGILWIAIFVNQQSYLGLLPGFILSGLSLPLIIPAAMTTALNSVKINKRGVVSGICGAARQTGAALGIAMVGSVIINLNRSYLSTYLQAAASPINKLTETQISDLLVKSSFTPQAMNDLPLHAVNEIYNVAKQAYSFAFSASMSIIIVLTFIAGIIASKLPTIKKFIEAGVINE
jgi:EmrB/QacA subfamily drug resistance transporter